MSFMLLCALYSYIMHPVNVVEKSYTLEEPVNIEINIDVEALKAIPLDTRYSVEYIKCNSGNVLDSWHGKEEIYCGDLYATIYSVLKRCPVKVEDIDGFISLIIETAANESFFGSVLKQKNGCALGVFQMEPTTYTCIQNHYLKYNKNLKNFVLYFKNSKLTNTDNVLYNIKYQIAYAIVHYIRYNAHHKSLKNKNERYVVYKSAWNTHKGKATISKFYVNLDKYLLNTYN